MLDLDSVVEEFEDTWIRKFEGVWSDLHLKRFAGSHHNLDNAPAHVIVIELLLDRRRLTTRIAELLSR